MCTFLARGMLLSAPWCDFGSTQMDMHADEAHAGVYMSTRGRGVTGEHNVGREKASRICNREIASHGNCSTISSIVQYESYPYMIR